MIRILFAFLLVVLNVSAAATQETEIFQLAIKYCRGMNRGQIGSDESRKIFRELQQHVLGRVEQNPIANKEHPVFQAVMGHIVDLTCKQNDVDDISTVFWVLKKLYGKKDQRVQDVCAHLTSTTLQLTDVKQIVEVARNVCEASGAENDDARALISHLAVVPLENAQQAKMSLALLIHYCDPNDEIVKKAELRFLEAIPEEEKCKTIIDAYLGYSLMGHVECICCIGSGWQFGKRRHHVVVDYLLEAVLKEEERNVRLTLDLLREIYGDAPPPQTLPVAKRFVELLPTIDHKYGELQRAVKLLADVLGRDSEYTQKAAVFLAEDALKQNIVGMKYDLEHLAKYCDKDSPHVQELSDCLAEKACEETRNTRDVLRTLFTIHGNTDPRVLRVADHLFEARANKEAWQNFTVLSKIFDIQDERLNALSQEMIENAFSSSALQAIVDVYGVQDARVQPLADRLYEEALAKNGTDMCLPLKLLKEIYDPEKCAVLEERMVELLLQETRVIRLGCALSTLYKMYGEESEIFTKLYNHLIALDKPQDLWSVHLSLSEKHKHQNWHQKLGDYLQSEGYLVLGKTKIKDLPWGGFTPW